ncbi:MAG: tRNA 2-thiocytidine biosynthesis protein TtcA [Clostridia bacterium]|nr:tRNA 2-thiocytidine biosynthesis protein TtcA [Clostridia bacterium]
MGGRLLYNNKKGGIPVGRQQLLSYMRAAVERYDLLSPGDRVAVGVSGGKDSLALIALLADYRRFSPVPFTLTAITLDPGFGGVETDFSAVADWCRTLDVPYELRRTQLADTAVERAAGKPPCSLCAKMRRGVLHKTARELDCNVVALGHHKNDAAETVLMNLLEGGRFACFSPKTDLDRSGLTLIRPLIFMEEREIAAFAAKEGLPVVASRCPVDGHTNRQRAKELAASLSATYGDVNDKILNALQTGRINGW